MRGSGGDDGESWLDDLPEWNQSLHKLFEAAAARLKKAPAESFSAGLET